MPIKTKTTSTYKQFLGYAKKVNILAVDNLKKNVPPEVIELLRDGISPTRNGEWVDVYSQRYDNQIKSGKYPNKTISPVNLHLTGKLYSSLKTTATPARGLFTMRFTDPKAKIHDQGLQGKPVRRLFPEGSQLLHPNLTLKITQSVRSAAVTVANLVSDR